MNHWETQLTRFVLMPALPSIQTPLNQHSLLALESWLSQLGAEKSSENPCLWRWTQPQWSAEILMKQEGLRVSWSQDGRESVRSFSYGLSRSDVETAILQGP